MKKQLYCLFDKVVESFLMPFEAHNEGEALRMCIASMAEPNKLSAHPEDFHLYRVGEFDHQTGELQHEIPVRVICLRDLAREHTEQNTLEDSNHGS